FKLKGVHEIVGIGTLFPDEQGHVSLHAHAAAGRTGHTSTGCTRPGIETWHVMEVILMELSGAKGVRVYDSRTAFSLLDPTLS
ncbi:MAG: DNA-binding protein, partial [Spirochaetales bacterium]|nr:DNA-binding protein [Spirochaetales bacterium]